MGVLAGIVAGRGFRMQTQVMDRADRRRGFQPVRVFLGKIVSEREYRHLRREYRERAADARTWTQAEEIEGLPLDED